MSEEFFKYDPSQPRDERGRFAEAGDHGAKAIQQVVTTAANGTTDPSTARDIGRAALTRMAEKAAALASKIKATIAGTRVTGLNPVAGGGIQIQAVHPLPRAELGHMETRLQVHPHDLAQYPTAQKTLHGLHKALSKMRPLVPMAAPQMDVRFKNGPAPRGIDTEVKKYSA